MKKKTVDRESRNPDLINRRLDSLARLVVGNTACAAIAFDGDKILVANNSNECHNLMLSLFAFFKDVADSNCTIEEIKNNSLLQQRLNDLESLAINEHIGRVTRNERELYRQAISKDIRKIVSSLAIDGDENKKFSHAFRDALSRGLDNGGVEFIPGAEVIIMDKSTGTLKETRVIIHAEMAILDSVISTGKLNVQESAVREQSFYIGTTMLCCRDCYKAVAALNDVSNLNKSSDKAMISDQAQLINTRGEHLIQFPWGEPQFFAILPEVKDKYKKIGEQTKFHSGIQLADASDSDPEITLEVKISAADQVQRINTENNTRLEDSIIPNMPHEVIQVDHEKTNKLRAILNRSNISDKNEETKQEQNITISSSDNKQNNSNNRKYMGGGRSNRGRSSGR